MIRRAIPYLLIVTVAVSPGIALALFFGFIKLADACGIPRPAGLHDPTVSFFITFGLFGWVFTIPLAILMLLVHVLSQRGKAKRGVEKG